MLFKLFLLFTIVPLIELALLIKIGQYIGLANTILIVLATGVTGAFLARSQGLRVLREIAADLSHGTIPTDSLLSGLLVLIAGALLITPGFLTDIVGLILLVPITRRILVVYLREYFRKKIERGDIHIFFNSR